MRRFKRIQDPEIIDRLLIDKELKEGNIVIVQFSDKTYTDKILADLNELCLRYDENFHVRFYGFYQSTFDCTALLKLPNVKALYIDCLRTVDNLMVITELKNLRSLSLGVFELKEIEIFQADNFLNLKELTIGDTNTKALNLKYLENYQHLNRLSICGHTKNIDAIGKITGLQYLGLNPNPKVSLQFINLLKKLRSLHMILGGLQNLEEIQENEIETLEMIRVRGFNSFNNISNFKKLKDLRIEDQIQLAGLKFDHDIPTLTDIKMINCKTLTSLTGLQKLSAFKHLRVSRTAINFDEFIAQPFPPSLKIFAFYTGKTKADNQIKQRLLKLGYVDGLSN